MKSIRASQRTSLWFPGLVVCFCALALYAQTFGMGFVSDDENTILSNYALHSLGNIPELFTKGMWPAGSADEYTYRPLFMAAMAIDYALWGGKPAGYHLISVLLHATSAVLVFLIAQRLVNRQLPALLAALLFAVHPVNVEPVAWISARCGLMSAGFALGAFYLYLRYRQDLRQVFLVWSIVLYLLAVFSKEDVIVFPMLVLIAEFSLFEWEGRRSLTRFFCYLMIAGFYFGVRTLVLKVVPGGGLPLSERLLTAPGMIAEYLRLLVFPYGQKVFYDIPIRREFWDAAVFGPLLCIIFLMLGWLLALRYDRRIFFCLGWVFIGLALFSGVPFMPQPSPMATRYLYFSAVGYCLLLGLLVAKFLENHGAAQALSHRTVIVFAIIQVSIFAIISWQQSWVWRDDVVFRNVYVADAPRVPQGHNGQGANYFRAGNFDRAAAAFSRAIELAPGYYDAHFNLGMTYLALEQTEKATRQFRRVLELNPSFPDALDQLGRLSLRQRDYDAALGYFGRAVQIDPNNPRYQQNYRLAMQLKAGQ